MKNYFKSLATPNSGNSSKAFALILSSIIGALMGICVCIVLLYDGLSDGVINTDLDKLGWFLLCTGAYSFGAGAGKIITDSMERRTKNQSEDSSSL
jgi:hypothetical protein